MATKFLQVLPSIHGQSSYWRVYQWEVTSFLFFLHYCSWSSHWICPPYKEKESNLHPQEGKLSTCLFPIRKTCLFPSLIIYVVIYFCKTINICSFIAFSYFSIKAMYFPADITPWFALWRSFPQVLGHLSDIHILNFFSSPSFSYLFCSFSFF